MTVTDAFFALLRYGLLDISMPAAFSLSDEQWHSLVALAKDQRVTGIIGRGISRLDASVAVPEDIIFQLMLDTDAIRRQSKKVKKLSEELISELGAQRLHPVLMKGPSVAALYSDPELRNPGDIDIYLQGDEFQTAAKWAAEKGFQVEKAPDASIQYQIDGIIVDQHREYFDLHVPEERLPGVPSAEAELLMLSSHILKHCMGPGIGVRQLCDMALAYRKIPFDRERLLEAYRRTGTLRWNRLLDAFLKDYFHTDSGLFPDEHRSPEPLARIVMRAGDFGHHSAGRHKAENAGGFVRKADTALRFLRGIPFSLRYAPREFFHYAADLAFGNLRRRNGRPIGGGTGRDGNGCGTGSGAGGDRTGGDRNGSGTGSGAGDDRTGRDGNGSGTGSGADGAFKGRAC